MLSVKNRLRLDKDFQNVFKKGKIFFSPFFNLKILPNTLKNSRFGIVVSTNISKKAVVRNKTKRQLRSIVQKNLSNISPNYDIVILTKPRVTIAKFEKLAKTFIFLLTKAKVYQSTKAFN